MIFLNTIKFVTAEQSCLKLYCSPVRILLTGGWIFRNTDSLKTQIHKIEIGL